MAGKVLGDVITIFTGATTILAGVLEETGGVILDVGALGTGGFGLYRNYWTHRKVGIIKI